MGLGRMGNLISNSIQKTEENKEMDFSFQDTSKRFIMAATAGISPAWLPEGIFCFFLFLLPTLFQKRLGQSPSTGKCWWKWRDLRNKKWLKWENSSLHSCFWEGCRVGYATGKTAGGVEALGGERRQKEEQKGSIQVTEQKRRRKRGKEIIAEGGQVREMLKRPEDSWMREPILRERVNLEPTMPPEWEDGQPRVMRWPPSAFPVVI